jgi:serine/threonine protein phosphatase 1
LPPNPKPHGSGKVAIVGHTAQKSGEVLDLGCVKGIDTFCHGGGWLMAMEVETGKVGQASETGQLRRKG